MFGQIEVKEPLEKLAEDWDLLADSVISHFSTSRAQGHNIYGLRKRLITAGAIDDPRKGDISRHFVLGPHGLEEGGNHALDLRITAAGTPHHVSHNFGYWHINDKDELYLPIPGEAG